MANIGHKWFLQMAKIKGAHIAANAKIEGTKYEIGREAEQALSPWLPSLPRRMHGYFL